MAYQPKIGARAFWCGIPQDLLPSAVSGTSQTEKELFALMETADAGRPQDGLEVDK